MNEMTIEELDHESFWEHVECVDCNISNTI